VVYAVELGLRCYGLGGLKKAFKNTLIKLDAFLVFCTVLDLFLRFSADSMGGDGVEKLLTQVSFLRCLRAFRVARAARMTVHLRTLWLLVSGLTYSALTIFWTFILMSFITYFFALIGMELIPPRDLSTTTEFDAVAVANFGSLMDSMLTLLQVLTMDSISNIYRPLISQGEMPLTCAAYFLFYLLFVSIALMNLVTAVMVEGAMAQASEDKEFKSQLEAEMKAKMIPIIRSMFEEMDDDGSGSVTLEEFCNSPDDLKEAVQEIVGEATMEAVFLLIDTDDSGFLEIEEFLEGLLKFTTGAGVQQFQMDRLVRQVDLMRIESKKLEKLVKQIGGNKGRL